MSDDFERFYVADPDIKLFDWVKVDFVTGGLRRAIGGVESADFRMPPGVFSDVQTHQLVVPHWPLWPPRST